jgi:hypothetical protein
MLNIKVYNMTSSNGNKVANQFIIHSGNKAYFQSYESVIAKTSKPVIANGKYIKPEMYLDKNKWDYSRITGKYRNQFLGETKKETEAKIKSGQYKLVNLN